MKESDYIFGLRPVIEAVRAGKQIDRLLIKQGLRGALYHELMTEVRNKGINFQIVPQERIDIVTRKNHQGVLAWLSIIEYQNIENLLPSVFEKGEDPLIVILDSVSDVRNFGAIVRTAHCFGAHAVIIPEKGSARITADAVKASAGALHLLPVCRQRSLMKTAKYLRDSGLNIICAEEKSETDISGTDLTGPVALILGSENQGISRELATLSNHRVRIPMSGTIGSLNVSTAAGIVLYEVIRQRGSGIRK